MIDVNQLIIRVGNALVDDTFTLWSKDFHRCSFNDALAALTLAHPALSNKTAEIQVAAGQWQVPLPDDAYLLLSVNHCNGYGLEQTEQERISHLYPDWRRQTDTRPTNWMRNPDDPLTFFIFPSTQSVQPIELTYSRHLHVSRDSDWVDIHDIYAPLLFDYLMYRAYSRDGQAEAQQAKAVSHFQAFQFGLGQASQ
ncbi:phage adaptor protein [Vibrio sp. MEBiC08052]|uniref:phage adaptor protein n=1 Tax=Vibrio sp. MEBiC08052 TaxID=1761910 RepID=UPI0007407B1A|nr:DUF6682 family protein [Vibrio sp. MEBiC08052]KUI98943.1 hypothetical protein VRK_19440 [Vibrio sp. MEBiC08052]